MKKAMIIVLLAMMMLGLIAGSVSARPAEPQAECYCGYWATGLCIMPFPGPHPACPNDPAIVETVKLMLII